VRDAGPLRFLRRLSLRLSGGGHEADQRVAHRHLHRVLGGAIARLPLALIARFGQSWVCHPEGTS